MRGKVCEEQRRQRAEEMMKSAAAQDEQDAEADDIEIGRQQDDKSLGGNEGRLSMDIAEQDDSMEEDGAEAEFPQHEDEEFPLPFDQEEEEVPFPNDEDETNAQFANDMPGMESHDKSEESQRSEFSLGEVEASYRKDGLTVQFHHVALLLFYRFIATIRISTIVLPALWLCFCIK